MYWILAPEPPVLQVCVPAIDDLLSNQDFLAAKHPMTWLRQKLIVNDQQIQQVLQNATRFEILNVCLPNYNPRERSSGGYIEITLSVCLSVQIRVRPTTFWELNVVQSPLSLIHI